MSDYGVVLFHTTSAALRAEKVLQSAKIALKLIPTPRELSSDCGVALRFNWQEAPAVEHILKEAKIDVSGIHELPQDRL